MGTRHDEKALLDGAVAAVLEAGLGELTFGRLAKRLGVADRTLVYYFANKSTLLEAVLGELGGRLLDALDDAFGDQPLPPHQLLTRAYPLLTTPEADRTFALWFELAGQAVGGQEPQRQLTLAMVEGWIEWLVPRIAHPESDDEAARRQRAVDLLVLLDGTLLLHHLGQPELAAESIRRQSAG